ncbi:hypothetical protein PS838_05968 [Pseudomonas fluorescens]|nr:hypothetical protein PS838_05968 [Pseudomonas fluorescens]
MEAPQTFASAVSSAPSMHGTLSTIATRPVRETASSERGVNCRVGSKGDWLLRVVDVGVAGSVNIRECPYNFRKLVYANRSEKTFSLVNVVVVHTFEFLESKQLGEPLDTLGDLQHENQTYGRFLSS